ncbi:MAG: hypothetical protein ABI606_22710, partial [Rhodoferax sp.]
AGQVQVLHCFASWLHYSMLIARDDGTVAGGAALVTRVGRSDLMFHHVYLYSIWPISHLLSQFAFTANRRSDSQKSGENWE